MKRKHTLEELKPIVESSLSYSECLKKLNLKQTGGNYKNLQRNIHKFSIDIRHMKHQAWNQGLEIKKFENLTKPESIKSRLIKEFGHFCSNCNNSHWINKPITLELDHIDGNNRNNSKENLRLLCPNCHSMTPTWRNRKR